MKVYLITGGAGFVGSNFIHYLCRVKNESLIVNVDKLTYAGNLANLQGLAEGAGYSFVQADIAGGKAMDEVFTTYRPDYVINFAAESHVDRSIHNPEPFMRTNILGTYNLLQKSLSSGVKRYVQVSTDEVYGSLETEFFTEDTPLNPTNPYAASKAAGDLLVLSYYRTYGLNAVITRCGNNYGPRQHREKWVPLIIAHSLAGKKIPLYGDGRNIREWVYVEDHCRAIDAVLERGQAGCVYNIGSGEEKENINLLRDVLAVLRGQLAGGDPRRDSINESLIEYVEDRKGHDRRYALDWQKIKKELGWQPEIGLEEGLRRTVSYYLEKKGAGVIR